MRGLTIIATLIATLILLGTAHAAHAPLTGLDTTDDALTDLIDNFDRIVLPQTLQEATKGHAQATLPGHNAPLTPNLDLLQHAPLLRTLDYATQLPTLETATQDPVDHDADTIEAQTSDTTLNPAPEAIRTSGDDATTSMQPADERTTQDDATATAQSDEASTSSTLQDAWDERSTAEKAAIGAGLLSLLLLGPLTMYSRIQRDDALENDTRRNIYEIVQNDPGVCIKDVATDADVSYSTASYHLDRLVRMDYIARRKEGNKVLYYKNGGTFTQGEQQLVPLLKNTEAMRVFQHILENPWCYRAEVAEALGVSHTTINWHLDNLQEADLVEEHREGRSCHLRIPEPALDRVVSVIEKLDDLGVENDDYARVAGPIPA